MTVDIYRAPGAAPSELLEHPRFAEPGEIERHLLGAFVPAVYQEAMMSAASPPAAAGSGRPSPQAPTWLAFLARHLNRLDTGDLAWWQLVDAIPRTALALCTALPVGLLFGVSGALVGGPLVALVLFLAFGAAAALSSAFARPPAPARVRLRFRATAAPFLSTFAGGCAAGLAVTLALRLPALAATGSGLVLGLAFAVRVWLDVPADAAEAPNPRVALAENRTATLSLALTLAVSLGFFDGLGFTVSRGLSAGTAGWTGLLIAALGAAAGGGFAGYIGYGWAGCVTFGSACAIAVGMIFAPTHYSLANKGSVGPAYGLVVGLAVGVAGTLSRAWGRFTVARTWLALCGYLPWRLMRFLDDAHRRGVLRQSGAVYEFRHVRLRDHLARTDPE